MKLQIFGIPTNRYAPPLYEKTLQKSGPKYEVRGLFFLSEAVRRPDESSAGFSRAKRIEERTSCTRANKLSRQESQRLHRQQTVLARAISLESV